MSLTVTRILELQNYCSMLHNVPTEVPRCYSGIFSYFMCLFHSYHIVNGESRSMWGVSGLYNIEIEGVSLLWQPREETMAGFMSSEYSWLTFPTSVTTLQIEAPNVCYSLAHLAWLLC